MHAQLLTGSAKTNVAQLAIADPQAFMECDLNEQVQWLTCKAKRYGYANLDHLLGQAPTLYTRLAKTWRQSHPYPAIHALKSKIVRQRKSGSFEHIV